MKLLYVEDNQLNSKLFIKFVKCLWDWKIDIASTAEIGLNLLVDNRYDLIYMDINLPGMNGIEAVRQVRLNKCMNDLPIIMVSADNRTSIIKNSLLAGANDFITKPICLEQLKIKSEEVLFNKL